MLHWTVKNIIKFMQKYPVYVDSDNDDDENYNYWWYLRLKSR